MKFNINESKRDDLLLKYVDLLNNNGINVNIGQVKSKLLNKFVVEGNIHNLSLRSNFYLAGVAKYYFSGVLTTNTDLSLLKKETWEGQDISDSWNVNVCKKLDAVINVLRNSYIDTVGTQMLEPEDFGELPINELLTKYKAEIKKELSTKSKKTNHQELVFDENVGDGYTFDIMYSYDDCKKYNGPTSPGAWCITYGKHHYDSYIRMLDIHYVIFRKNGWENVKRPEDPRKEPNWTKEKPHDEYGNSLIALLQSNENGEPVYITSRWNHGYGISSCEADHAYTKEEFQQITGVTDEDLKRIFNIWNVNKNKRKNKSIDKNEENFVMRSLKYLQMRINAGENPAQLFDTTNHVYGSQKLNKGTFICSAKISETTIGTNSRIVYFVFDNGKIVFQTVCTTSSAMNNIENTAIIIDLTNDKHIIYSLKKHKVLSIDGNYIFRRIPDLSSTDNYGDYYFQVKEGRFDIALFSTETMEPIQLPNGAYWFNHMESNVGYHYESASRIDCRMFSKAKSLCFHIIYDMSSGEEYFYSANSDSFFELKTPKYVYISPSYYNNYTGGKQPSTGFKPFLERQYQETDSPLLPVRYGVPQPRVGNIGGFYYTNDSDLQIIKDGKPLKICGSVWFKDFTTLNDDFRIINSEDGTRFLTDIDVNKYMFFGKEFRFIRVECVGKNDDIYFITLYNKKNQKVYVIYQLESNSCLISPVTNSTLFYGHSTYSWNWNNTRKSHGECFEFEDVSVIPENLREYGDVEDSKFIITYDNLVSLCQKTPAPWFDVNTNSKIVDTTQLDREDVKAMVRESINKLLKKIISA